MTASDHNPGEPASTMDYEDELQLALKLSLEEYKWTTQANQKYASHASGFFESIKNDVNEQSETQKRPDDTVSMSFILDQMHHFHKIIKNEVDVTHEQNSHNASPTGKGGPRLSATMSRNRLADLVETLFGTEENRTASMENIRSWCKQGFCFQENPKVFWGLKQQYLGPCGVLASVQSYMLQCILFHSGIYGSLELMQQSDTPENVLMELHEVYYNFIRLEHPDFPEEWLHIPALLEALCAVLYNATPDSHYKVILFEPLKTQSMANAVHAIMYSSNYVYVEFDSISQVASHLLKNIHLLMWEMGVMSITLSVLATRGVENVRNDMDDPSIPMVGIYGHTSQELVNLLLQGRAVSNVFDGEKVLQDSDKSLSYKLKGIPGVGCVGFLSEREASRHCAVGSYYKYPKYPVWVVASFSHYTVLFALNMAYCKRTEAEMHSVNALSVWSCLDPDDNKFISQDLLPSLLEMLGVTPLYKDACNHVIADSNLVLQTTFLDWYMSRTASRSGKRSNENVTLFHYNGQDSMAALSMVSVKHISQQELGELRKSAEEEDEYVVDSTIAGFAKSPAVNLAKTIWTRWPKTLVDTLQMRSERRVAPGG
ncbi:FAM188A-like protein isoform X1, putative [Babesia ovata]|uniref:FAM188A-like protein isoform X1, putative n=1 Tax=Babesia ovata TaxID=189622 RepID=A0A2H6K6K3_9APIC|nr:FAM188A-like protein isoform X1, putative [Babesia ovata]GBE58623.1 FAM188A-like protein isoform X1, putative [Babesia ovata]